VVGLFFDSEDGDVSPKRQLIFIGLHNVISQKIVFSYSNNLIGQRNNIIMIIRNPIRILTLIKFVFVSSFFART
jgi:hypothetical protein